MLLMENWILLAILTPTLWAMGCILDSCLVGCKVYQHASDGAVVSCFFCVLPAALVIVVDASAVMNMMDVKMLPKSAIAAGVAYTVHLYFYFRSLRCLNDASGAETFISLSVLFVPVFAWLLLDEILPAHFYIAFMVAAAGVFIQCLPVIKAVGLKLLINMSITMLAVSLSMVLQSHALEHYGFSSSTFVFNMTCFVIAVFVVAVSKPIRRRMLFLYRQYPLVLILGEMLGVLAVLSSHRATQQGPSVSVIALIECLLPLMIILLSSAAIYVNRFLPVLSERHAQTLSLQFQSTPSKVCAMTLILLSLGVLMM